ncbi:hypothetical protein AB7M17_006698 [Bradyrhizobium sp. USDA 377]
MIKVHVYRQKLGMGYTIDPDAFPPPEGWSHFRTIECFASTPFLGSEAVKLLSGLSRDGFHIPSESY